ncbi:MAG: sulfotransferase [Cyanobacteriota bacterium]|nr:sulfotransferase [Cyanobacteriota bacterium]
MFTSRRLQRQLAAIPPWLREPFSLDGTLAEAITAGLRGDHQDLVDSQSAYLPNFIVIGAPKAATTTLTSILQRHPQVFVSNPKEPKFFGRRYYKGWRWYGRMFRPGRRHPWRGEASTMYSSPNKNYRYTAALMHRYIPGLKIVYLVRDPLKRLESQWRHMKGWNPKTCNFPDILKAPRSQRELLVGCSLYYANLQRFRAFFADSQIHCISFEDLVAEPAGTLVRLLQFLGASPSVDTLLDGGQLPRVNSAGDKGRALIAPPTWTEPLRQRLLGQLAPDGRRMLAYMGKPSSHWQL